jgi:LAO/AO transport system kinase
VKPFFVYMLRCADGSFYVGHTDELERRVAQHRAGEIAGCYTHDRRPVTLAWSQETASREEALSAELQIKGWARSKKQALIDGDWQAIRRHAWGTRNPLPEGLRASIPQPERGEEEGLRGRVPRPERGGVEGFGASIPEPERGGGELGASIPQPERGEVRGSGDSIARPERGGVPVRPEVSKGERPGGHLAPPHSNNAPPDALALALIEAHGPARRRAIAKAITLLESTRADHRARADALLTALLPHTGKSLRLGISGSPGVGKSTFIETLGLRLIERGHRVAVLAIDPSSSLSGGSILGDKTRMARLSVDEHAYIRPSPASGTLGGVAAKTRESMLVCEAAGHDIVIVETVGVGQSETAVASMTDMFVLLQLPNAGDDLQAIKKGVMELADLVVINKADLDAAAATRAEAQIRSALRLFGRHGRPEHAAHDTTLWQPQVMRLSALSGDGVDDFWSRVEAFAGLQRGNGGFERRRREQAEAWMWDMIHAALSERFLHHPSVRNALKATTARVARGELPPSTAARALLARFGNDPEPH